MTEELNRPYLCVHAPRKEWRNILPIKINVIMAKSNKEARAAFIPFHPNDPETKHYNKPVVVSSIMPFYLD